MTPDGQMTVEEFFNKKKAVDRLNWGLAGAKEFLEMLTAKVPITAKTTPQVAHNLSVTEHGLTLTVWHRGRWQCFYLDYQDLCKPAPQMVAEIVGMLK